MIRVVLCLKLVVFLSSVSLLLVICSILNEYCTRHSSQIIENEMSSD